MKKFQRSELTKMSKGDLVNLVIEIQDNIILTKDMANRNGRPKLKVSEEMKNNILFLHNQGKGSRYIGEVVGMSHTNFKRDDIIGKSGGEDHVCDRF